MKKLLLVDGSAIFRAGVMKCIESSALGGRVSIDERVNGAEACDYVAMTLPDVVLMNVRMPVVSGSDAARRMRAGGYSGTIILYAGYSPTLASLRKNSRGADCVVDKSELLSGRLAESLSPYLMQ